MTKQEGRAPGASPKAFKSPSKAKKMPGAAPRTPSKQLQALNLDKAGLLAEAEITAPKGSPETTTTTERSFTTPPKPRQRPLPEAPPPSAKDTVRRSAVRAPLGTAKVKRNFSKELSAEEQSEVPKTPVKETKQTPVTSPIQTIISVPAPVKKVYSLIERASAGLGGNGYNGAIYGELTIGGMQKVVNLLRDRCDFGPQSSFIDVGSGLGKPNFHVSQDPGCECSFGVELEEIRWDMSITILESVLGYQEREGQRLGPVFFKKGDITGAKTFNPFTHVYMFDIGFPPPTLTLIAKMFNKSQAHWLVSYQIPRRVINEYGYNVEVVHQMPLSLTGSGEGHTMYLYRRLGSEGKPALGRIQSVDPFFKEGVDLCRKEDNGADLRSWVLAAHSEYRNAGRQTRSKAKQAR